MKTHHSFGTITHKIATSMSSVRSLPEILDTTRFICDIQIEDVKASDLRVYAFEQIGDTLYIDRYVDVEDTLDTVKAFVIDITMFSSTGDTVFSVKYNVSDGNLVGLNGNAVDPESVKAKFRFNINSVTIHKDKANGPD